MTFTITFVVPVQSQLSLDN